MSRDKKSVLPIFVVNDYSGKPAYGNVCWLLSLGMVGSQWLTNQLTPSNSSSSKAGSCRFSQECYAAYIGSYLPTFRHNLPVPSSGLKQSMNKSRVVSYSPPCVEAEGSLSCSQKPGTLFCP